MIVDAYGNDISGQVKEADVKNLKEVCLLIEKTALWYDYENFFINETILEEILKKCNNLLNDRNNKY
jgi:hypothetical protein